MENNVLNLQLSPSSNSVLYSAHEYLPFLLSTYVPEVGLIPSNELVWQHWKAPRTLTAPLAFTKFDPKPTALFVALLFAPKLFLLPGPMATLDESEGLKNGSESPP